MAEATLSTIIDQIDVMRDLSDTTINAIRMLVEDGEFQVELGESTLTLALIDTAIFIVRDGEFLGAVTYQGAEPLGYLAPPFDADPDATSIYGIELATSLYPYAAHLLDQARQRGVETTADDADSSYNDIPAGNRVWRVLGAVFPQIHDWMPERYRDPDPDDILHRRILVEMEKHASGWDTEQVEQNMDDWRPADSEVMSQRVSRDD